MLRLAGILMASGDVLSQFLVERKALLQYDACRTSRFFLFGTFILVCVLVLFHYVLQLWLIIYTAWFKKKLNFFMDSQQRRQTINFLNFDFFISYKAFTFLVVCMLSSIVNLCTTKSLFLLFLCAAQHIVYFLFNHSHFPYSKSC